MNKFYLLAFATCLQLSCQNNGSKTPEPIETGPILITDENGNSISQEELAEATGNYNYEILGMDNVSAQAQNLLDSARSFGQQAKYEQAISYFERAHLEAPNWAYPPYDLGYTYLLQEDYENAYKYYSITDSIAPNGFYTSKTALYTLEQERNGDLKEGIYKMYLSLEWIVDPTEKLEVTALMVENFPTFAPAWSEYSNLLEGAERKNAIEKGLQLNSDVQTQGTLLINKALILNEEGDYEEAKKILMNIIFSDLSTYGNIEMAKFVLNNISF